MKNAHLYMTLHRSIILRPQKYKSPKCSSTDEWIDKIQCIHTMVSVGRSTESEVISDCLKWVQKTVGWEVSSVGMWNDC